jgi:hypothetical protein
MTTSTQILNNTKQDFTAIISSVKFTDISLNLGTNTFDGTTYYEIENCDGIFFTSKKEAILNAKRMINQQVSDREFDLEN